MYSAYFISAFARKLWRGEHCWSGHTSALVVGFHCQFMVKIATLVDALMSFATWCHHLVKDNKASARLAIEVLMQGADSHKLSDLHCMHVALHPSTVQQCQLLFKAFDWSESSIHMPCKELALFSLHAENLSQCMHLRAACTEELLVQWILKFCMSLRTARVSCLNCFKSS